VVNHNISKDNRSKVDMVSNNRNSHRVYHHKARAVTPAKVTMVHSSIREDHLNLVGNVLLYSFIDTSSFGRSDSILEWR
jgi:hypothetical protein